MSYSRRSFIKAAGAAAALSALPFPGILLGRQPQKLGVALVGLGNYSTGQLGPALRLTRHCQLRGIVTGSPDKVPLWQQRYSIPDKNVYNYGNIHQVADNPDIDVLYIVLPNSMHKEYAIKAAEAGKHVWCEKPMALNAKECREIIAACKKNNVKLCIGYRMQHEPDTQTIIRYGRQKTYGDITGVETEAGFRFSGGTPWRLEKEMGGGAMYDMGVYPLNAARYSTGLEPIAVTARHEVTRPDMFSEVDEITYFTLEFPGGIKADCKTSFAENINRLQINCTQGWYRLQPFQSYSGIRGTTSDGTTINERITDQQALQMDDDALAILQNRPVLVPGEEGLRDLLAVDAIFQSAASGKRVRIPPAD
ncbi:Gfo/Idh/MocA family protein [Roseivirga sp. BDSF3-8]|uniref:Gfo/Idh/MocA family protein n=1 Tax=Roseivirga sp. BDSF3-8 TaxID=3241598 RepID=UPI0035321994